MAAYPELQLIWDQLKLIKDELPRNKQGIYRGYINVALGDQIIELEKLLGKWDVEEPKVPEEYITEIHILFNKFITALPRNKSNRILGYLRTEVARAFIDMYGIVADLMGEKKESHFRRVSVAALPNGGIYAHLPRRDKGKLKIQSQLQDLTDQIQADREAPQEELLAQIKAVFEETPTLFSIYNFDGDTLLTECVGREANTLLKALLDICSKEYYLAKNKDGSTAVHEAVARGNQDALGILLNALDQSQKDTVVPNLVQSFRHVPDAEIEGVISFIKENTGIELQNPEDDLSELFSSLNCK